MNTTVYAAMLMAILNTAPGVPKDKDFMEISRGQAGRVHLMLREEPRRRARPVTVAGIRGEYDDGRSVWLAQGEGRGVEVGIGYKREF